MPGDRFGIAGTGGLDRLARELDCAVHIARQPAQMSGARVRLVERLEVDHLLIGSGRLGQASLFHQRVAEQSVVEHELPLRHERACDELGLVKAMELMQRVTAEQKRRRIARLLLVETGRDALSEDVVAGIVGCARSGHELVAKLLQSVTPRRRPSRSFL